MGIPFDTFLYKVKKLIDIPKRLKDTFYIREYLIPFSNRNMPIETDIGGRIRALRQNDHLTLKQLAEKVGCTDAYLSQLENGSRFTVNSELEEDCGCFAD